MKNLKAKLNKQGGFTLIEMLIVVAIIAILIAVSIPMVSSALERSRHAVDQANNRDATALAAIEYLTDEELSKATTETEYKYVVNSAHQGALIKKDETKTGYSDVEPSCSCTGACTAALTVKIDKDGNITTNWKFDDSTGKTLENT